MQWPACQTGYELAEARFRQWNRLGARLLTAVNVEALTAQLEAGAPDAAIVLLDLNTPGLNPGELVSRLKMSANPPRAIVAFGPHVQEAKLAAAKAAGCDLVLSRGQFDAQFNSIIEQLFVLSNQAGEH